MYIIKCILCIIVLSIVQAKSNNIEDTSAEIETEQFLPPKMVT